MFILWTHFCGLVMILLLLVKISRFCGIFLNSDDCDLIFCESFKHWWPGVGVKRFVKMSTKYSSTLKKSVEFLKKNRASVLDCTCDASIIWLGCASVQKIALHDSKWTRPPSRPTHYIDNKLPLRKREIVRHRSRKNCCRNRETKSLLV